MSTFMFWRWQLDDYLHLLLAGGKASSELRIQAAFDGACAAAAAAVLPAGLYAAVHFSMLGELRHLFSLAILGSLPVLFLSVVEVS